MGTLSVHFPMAIVCTFTFGIILVAAVNEFSLPNRQCYVYRRPGDLILGGMFTIARTTELSCDIDDDRMSLATLMPEAMAFAIGEINRRDDILPNISLGFEIWDSSWKESIASGIALSFVNDSSCTDDGSGTVEEKVVGIIGPATSTNSVVVSRITQPYQLPIISHWATSDELSDKNRYPYFLRSVPPDKLQADAIVDLLLRFDWRYVALIYSVDSYGLHGARELTTQAEERGVCIALTATLSLLDTDRDLESIVLKLKALSSLRVVVIFATAGASQSFLRQMSKTSFPYNLTWIGSDGWGYSSRVARSEELAGLLAGGIFIQLDSPKDQAFEEYLNSVDPRQENAAGQWFTRYWKKNFAPNCSETDPIEMCATPLPDGFSALYNTAGPIDAVNIFARGLHSLLMETCSPEGAQANCSFTPAEINGEDLRKHLARVNFTGVRGEIHLDENGDPEGVYTLTNLRESTGNGRYHFEAIGTWDSVKKQNRLELDVHRIQWPGRDAAVPRSTCRQKCSVGYIVVPLEQKCCWGCQRCDINAVVMNGNMCKACPITHWPNNAYDTCVPIIPATISFSDPLILVIFVLTCKGYILSCLTIAGMVYYRKSRLVKSTSKELSGINLLGLTTAFLAIIPLLQPPTSLTCAASEVLISVCFTTTYAPTLLKVFRIYRIFSAGKKMVRPPRFVGSKELVTVACILILLQLIAAVTVSVLDPPHPDLLFTSPPSNHIELYCVFSKAFPGLCGYNLLIVLLCCYYAFRARKVPDNYNESKFIGVSVYSTLVLSLAALPVYTTAREARQKIAVLAMVVLVNSFLTIFCVYFPKLVAVRFRFGDRVEEANSSANTLPSTRPTMATQQQHNTVVM